MPLKRSEVIEAFYDAHLKLFKCPFPDYQVTSKRKSNLKRHIKSCETQKKKKKKKKKKESWQKHMPLLQNYVFAEIQPRQTCKK